MGLLLPCPELTPHHANVTFRGQATPGRGWPPVGQWGQSHGGSRKEHSSTSGPPVSAQPPSAVAEHLWPCFAAPDRPGDKMWPGAWQGHQHVIPCEQAQAMVCSSSKNIKHNDRHWGLNLGKLSGLLMSPERVAHLNSPSVHLWLRTGHYCGPQPAEDESWRPHNSWSEEEKDWRGREKLPQKLSVCH